MEKIKSKFKGLLRRFSIINKELSFFYKNQMNFLNITKTESIYIRVIYENQGVTQYEIAKIMEVTKNLVIKHISNLEEKNIIRKENIGDYKKGIFLTKQGLSIVEGFAENLEFLGDVMFQNLTTEEIENYIKISALVEENLYKYNKRKLDESYANYKKFE